MKVERWGVFETSLKGPSEGNPFIDHKISAVFTGKNEKITVDGFYDSDGVYKVRFMPSFEGEYSYKVTADFLDEDISGEFEAVPPTGNNHGPVRVVNQHHFAYGDMTPYYSVGTTCYAWVHQPEETVKKTYEELSKGYFNKIRFCVFPKHYVHNFKDPVTFPYIGTPVSTEGINEENFWSFTSCEGNNWDFKRFNPEHFKRVEKAIENLMNMGVEADLIVMHPYDRWGFSKMSREEDDLYWNYIIARFAAYRNLWWSLANEYDLMNSKTMEDWERYAKILCDKDPYNHLRSVHNCMAFYDYTRPWVTHCSMQRQDLYRHVEYTDDYRVRYGKPVVWDEIAYEGNIEHGWGNISGQELVRRFWEASLRGGYAGHGETYAHSEEILWWSHGGELHGESHRRIKFLHGILCETPGMGLKRAPGIFDETVAWVDSPFADDSYEIHYFGFGRPSFRNFDKDKDKKYKVEIIDTWEMTVTDAGIHSGKFRINLPGKEYIAVRIIRF